MQENLIIVGCGYTGRRLAMRAVAEGVATRGITSSDVSSAELRSLRIPARAWDLDAPVPGPCPWPVTSGDRLIYLVPPPGEGDADPRFSRCLEALGDTPPGALVYMSTTGVYGDRRGASTDESVPARPGSRRARRRVAAEEIGARWAREHRCAYTVLRVSGIYGPGRLPLQALRRGDPVVAANQSGPGNRIHVDDLVSVCLAATRISAGERVFNVSDGCHMSRTAFLFALARLAGLDTPREVSPEDARAALTPLQWSFLSESRRIDNARMLSELGVTLRYPDPGKGIEASLLEERG